MSLTFIGIISLRNCHLLSCEWKVKSLNNIFLEYFLSYISLAVTLHYIDIWTMIFELCWLQGFLSLCDSYWACFSLGSGYLQVTAWLSGLVCCILDDGILFLVSGQNINLVPELNQYTFNFWHHQLVALMARKFTPVEWRYYFLKIKDSFLFI